MSINNLTISMKLGVMAAILLILLGLAGYLGLRGMKIGKEEALKLTYLEKLDITVLNREVDHLQWATGVSTFILDKNQNELRVEVNENNCMLGKWLNNTDQMQEIKSTLPGAAALIERIKIPHAELHKTAVELKQSLTRHNGNKQEAMDELVSVYGAKTLPALAKVRQGLHEIIEEVDTLVQKEEVRMHDVVKQTNFNIKMLLAIAMLVGISISFFISRLLTKPIGQTMDFIDKLSQGDFTTRLEITQEDEIGKMAASLNDMVTNLKAMIHDISGGVKTLSSSSAELASVSNQLAGSARETSLKSETVATAAEEMSSNINSVSAAMEQSSANTSMVASGTEEMSATVSEIAKSAEKARTVSESAVEKSLGTTEMMNQLGESADRIGRVTETITEISEQTNLLALNATIEAARAGEAGKGFAVVANEIKDLAKQTADATVDIKNQIEEMQGTTKTTVTDMAAISDIIDHINEIINTIASAVEEQSASTSEIAGNIAQTSQGIAEVNESVAQSTIVVSDITREIAEISRAATEVDSGSTQVQSSAAELSKLADQLNVMVSKFRVN